MQGCCNLPFCRLRRREGGSEDTSRSGKGLSPYTRTSKRGIPNLATAMDHNETYWYSTTYTFHKVQKYYALASEAGTFPGRDAIMIFNKQQRSCHPERNKGSDASGTEILRCAQDDSADLGRSIS